MEAILVMQSLTILSATTLESPKLQFVHAGSSPSPYKKTRRSFAFSFAEQGFSITSNLRPINPRTQNFFSSHTNVQSLEVKPLAYSREIEQKSPKSSGAEGDAVHVLVNGGDDCYEERSMNGKLGFFINGELDDKGEVDRGNSIPSTSGGGDFLFTFGNDSNGRVVSFQSKQDIGVMELVNLGQEQNLASPISSVEIVDDNSDCNTKNLSLFTEVSSEIVSRSSDSPLEVDKSSLDSSGNGGIGKIDVRALAMELRSAKDVEDIGKVLEGKEVPLRVYSTIIRGFGLDKTLSPAFALVEWLKSKQKKKNKNGGDEQYVNTYIYNSLLGAMKASEEYEDTNNVLEDMLRQGILPDVITYNTLMWINLEQGKYAEALKTYEEIKEKGLTPSCASYSTALLIRRRMEDAIGAVQLFVELRERYQKGEIVRYENENWEVEFVKLEDFTIRICYEVMRRWLVNVENRNIDVLKLLDYMDRMGIQSPSTMYERLVRACMKENQHVVAKELYTRIRENDQEVSVSVCNHVIWLLGKAKKWWAALEIYENMLEIGPKPNNVSRDIIVSHFNVLLTSAKKRGIWKWAVQLIDKMQERGLNPGSREWNSVLVACSRASEASAAVEIFTRMVEQGHKPTILSYGALLSALEKGKMYDKAINVWEHLRKVGMELNLYVYTTMTLVYVGMGNLTAVGVLLQEMVSVGIEPTVVTYNAIISGCARNGMGGEAFEWFHKMQVNNIEPNQVTYEMLIESLTKDGKPRLAYEMYQKARSEGLSLSPKAFDAVVSSSEFYKAGIDMSLLDRWQPETRTVGKE